MEKPKKPKKGKCRDCGLEREPWERFYGGLCAACHAGYARKRRRTEADKMLAKAAEGGFEERDGQMFRVVVLPARRPRRLKDRW